jgi:hypothetical protein
MIHDQVKVGDSLEKRGGNGVGWVKYHPIIADYMIRFITATVDDNPEGYRIVRDVAGEKHVVYGQMVS